MLPISRLRLLVLRTATSLPPVRAPLVDPQWCSSSSTTESPEADVMSANAQLDFTTAMMREEFVAGESWNNSFSSLVLALSTLGPAVTHQSDWLRLKVYATKHAKEMHPITAMHCLRTFIRHRVCGKTEAMRLQEVIAKGYQRDLRPVERIMLLHSLCVLQVPLAAPLLREVSDSAVSLAEHCPPFAACRFLYAMATLLQPGDTRAEKALALMMERVREANLKFMSVHDKIYFLWITQRFLSARPPLKSHTVELLKVVLGVGDGTASVSHVTTATILGQTNSESQLTVKDTTFLMHALCRAVVSIARGGIAKVGEEFYRARKAALRSGQQPPLVDELLFSRLALPGNDALVLQALRGHIDATAHRLCSALFSCELLSMDVACSLLSAITQAGLVFVNTTVQLLCHALIRFVLFRYRDAIYFDSDAVSAQGEGALGGLVMLRDTPTFTEEERTRLILLRLDTNLERLETLLRPSLTEKEATTVLKAIAACKDIFSEATTASQQKSVGENGKTVTFEVLYRTLVERKLQRPLLLADAKGFVALVHSAAVCGALTSATMYLVIDRLSNAGFPTACRLKCASIACQYLETSTRISISNDARLKLKAMENHEQLDAANLVASICETARGSLDSRQVDSIHNSFTVLLSKRGAFAAQPRQLRAALRILSKSSERNPGLHTLFSKERSLHSGAAALIDRAAHGCSRSSMIQLLLDVSTLGAQLEHVTAVVDDIATSFISEPATRLIEQREALSWLVVIFRFSPSHTTAWTLYLLPNVLHSLHLSSDENWVKTVRVTVLLELLSGFCTYGIEDDALIRVVCNEIQLRQGQLTAAQKISECDDGRLVVKDVIGTQTVFQLCNAALCTWFGPPVVMPVVLPLCVGVCQQIVSRVEESCDASLSASVQYETMIVCAAAATVIHHLSPQEQVDCSTIQQPLQSLENSIERVVRKLFTDNPTSLTSMISLPKVGQFLLHQSQSILGRLCSYHQPVSLLATVSHCLQRDASSDARKLLGAQLWRQCIKQCEKSAATFDSNEAQSGDDDQLTRFTIATIGFMTRFGASSQSLDTLLIKCMRRSKNAPSAFMVAFLADSLVIGNKKRPVATESIATCVGHADAHVLQQLPSYSILALLNVLRRDYDRVTLGVVRSENCSIILWSVLSPRLHLVPVEVVVGMTSFVPPEFASTVAQELSCRATSMTVAMLRTTRDYVESVLSLPAGIVAATVTAIKSEARARLERCNTGALSVTDSDKDVLQSLLT